MSNSLRDEKSGVTGDCHAPFCGSPEVQSLRATRPVDLILLGVSAWIPVGCRDLAGVVDDWTWLRCRRARLGWLHARIAPRFARSEPCQRVLVYLNGLLGPQVPPDMRSLGENRGTVLFVNAGSAVTPGRNVTGTSVAFAGQARLRAPAQRGPR